MSRVHSNIAMVPHRRLTKQFTGATKAISTGAPTKLSQAMGQAGKNGVVSFIMSDGGTQNITLWQWNAAWAKANSGNGWALLGNNVSESTQSCDAGAVVTFECSEDAFFFIQAAGDVTDCIVSGTEAGVNANTDNTSGITH